VLRQVEGTRSGTAPAKLLPVSRRVVSTSPSLEVGLSAMSVSDSQSPTRAMTPARETPPSNGSRGSPAEFKGAGAAPAPTPPRLGVTENGRRLSLPAIQHSARKVRPAQRARARRRLWVAAAHRRGAGARSGSLAQVASRQGDVGMRTISGWFSGASTTSSKVRGRRGRCRPEAHAVRNRPLIPWPRNRWERSRVHSR